MDPDPDSGHHGCQFKKNLIEKLKEMQTYSEAGHFHHSLIVEGSMCVANK